MATVTSFTAKRIKAIEDAAVVDGEVVGDDLILKRFDGDEINAGNVRGLQGVQGNEGAADGFINIFRVRQYGAIGNGLIDDTLAIRDTVNAAEDYTATNPGFYALVWFDAGTYLMNTYSSTTDGLQWCVLIKGNNITIDGRGAIIKSTVVNPGALQMFLPLVVRRLVTSLLLTGRT